MTKEPVGSVGVEAAKLFAVLQQAAANGHATQPEAAETPAEQGDPAHEHGGGRAHEEQHRLGPDCQWCPVCQVISMVRHTNPETVEHLASAAAGVLGSVRSLLDAAAESARQAGPADTATKPSASGVDRIDVSEDPEPWD